MEDTLSVMFQAFWNLSLVSNICTNSVQPGAMRSLDVNVIFYGLSLVTSTVTEITDIPKGKPRVRIKSIVSGIIASQWISKTRSPHA